MTDVLSLAGQNLLSPIILSFALGLAAAFARSDLSVPEAAAKALSIYLLFAIGFKGGVSVAAHGVDATLMLALLAGVVLSAILPLVAYAMIRAMTRLGQLDAAGHAVASLEVPGGLPASLAGARMYHAYVVFDASGFAFVSNAFPLLFLP